METSAFFRRQAAFYLRLSDFCCDDLIADYVAKEKHPAALIDANATARVHRGAWRRGGVAAGGTRAADPPDAAHHAPMAILAAVARADELFE